MSDTPTVKDCLTVQPSNTPLMAIQELRRKLADARAERDRFISTLITMREALVLNGTRLTDDAINAYEELKLSVTNAAAGKEKS